MIVEGCSCVVCDLSRRYERRDTERMTTAEANDLIAFRAWLDRLNDVDPRELEW